MAEGAERPGENDAAAEAAAEKAHGLRRIKYRMILIFLLAPFGLVAAISFKFLWDLDLGRNMTQTGVIAIYGGLIVLFGIGSFTVGYFVKKRMRREEEDAIAAARTAPKPVGLTSRDKRSRR